MKPHIILGAVAKYFGQHYYLWATCKELVVPKKIACYLLYWHWFKSVQGVMDLMNVSDYFVKQASQMEDKRISDIERMLGV